MLKIFFVFGFFMLSGCVSAPVRTPMFSRFYLLGHEQTAVAGAIILARENFTQVQHKVWVGLLMAPGGWQITESKENMVREEFIYTGRENDIIRINYREYANNSSQPAYFQELIYDLKNSDTIGYKDYVIKVIEADKERIRFVVLQDLKQDSGIFPNSNKK